MGRRLIRERGDVCCSSSCRCVIARRAAPRQRTPAPSCGSIPTSPTPCLHSSVLNTLVPVSPPFALTTPTAILQLPETCLSCVHTAPGPHCARRRLLQHTVLLLDFPNKPLQQPAELW